MQTNAGNERLEYIGEMLQGLQAMARDDGEAMLSYLIAMAQEEASLQKQRRSAACGNNSWSESNQRDAMRLHKDTLDEKGEGE